MSVARLGDAVGNSILFIIIPLYVAKLPSPWFSVPEPVRVGILISLYGMVNATLQPLTGALCDRIGRKKPLIQGGLVLMAAGTLAFLLARRYTDLLFLRALQGIGVAVTIPASMALMAAATEQRTRGGAMGVYTTMRVVGFGVGPLIGGFLQVHFGFAAAFFTGAGFIIIAVFLVHFWVPEVRGERPSAGQSFRIIDPGLLTPGILGAALATFVMALSYTLMVTLEAQFNDRLHETAMGFSIAFSALMVTRLLFQFPLGRLSDRIGRKPLIVAGLIVIAPATGLMGVVVTTAQLTGLRLLQGLASAAIAAPAFALAGDLSGAGGQGRQMSMVTMGFSLGIALGPLISGFLALHSFELPFLVGGVLSLAAAWVVHRFVPETLRR